MNLHTMYGHRMYLWKEVYKYLCGKNSKGKKVIIMARNCCLDYTIFLFNKTRRVVKKITID